MATLASSRDDERRAPGSPRQSKTAKPDWLAAWLSSAQRRRGLASGRSRDRANHWRNRLVVRAVNRADGDKTEAARLMGRKYRSSRRLAQSMGGWALDWKWPRNLQAGRSIVRRVLARLDSDCVCHACEDLRGLARGREPVDSPETAIASRAETEMDKDETQSRERLITPSEIRRIIDEVQSRDGEIRGLVALPWVVAEIRTKMRKRWRPLTKARKKWQCYLCRHQIPKGDHYRRISADGEWVSPYGWLRYPDNFAVCLSC